MHLNAAGWERVWTERAEAKSETVAIVLPNSPLMKREGKPCGFAFL